MEKQFPYQIAGSEWLAGRNWALLADDMGLGKSNQCVVASDIIGAEKILIICPASARVNWERQYELWSLFSRNFKVCYGKDDYPEERTICSFEYATEHRDRLLCGEWDLLIIDECHYIKTADAERTRAILGKMGLIRRTKRCWAVSGTPAPNHAGELWPILFTFGVTPLSYAKFVERYCNGYWERGEFRITGSKNYMAPELKELLGKIMLRRLKKDVMKELPEIFYSEIVVEAGPVDLEFEASFIQYVFPDDRREELKEKLNNEQRILNETIGRLGFGKNGMKVLEGLADSISTLRRYNGLQKVKSVAEIVGAELDNNAYKKIVLFAIHRDVIEGLRAKLSRHKPVVLYGRTDPATRQKNIDKFMNNPKCRVFIGNIKAAGVAITLTSSNQVMLVEQSWTPGDNAQAIMRVHRIGQTETVFVRVAGLANSIDQKVARVLKQKTKALTEIFDDEVPEAEFEEVEEKIDISKIAKTVYNP